MAVPNIYFENKKVRVYVTFFLIDFLIHFLYFLYFVQAAHFIFKTKHPTKNDRNVLMATLTFILYSNVGLDQIFEATLLGQGSQGLECITIFHL